MLCESVIAFIVLDYDIELIGNNFYVDIQE